MVINKITQAKKQAIESKSVLNLPGTPSRFDYSEQKVKRAFIDPITGDSDSLAAEVNRIVDELNAILQGEGSGTLETTAQALIGAINELNSQIALAGKASAADVGNVSNLTTTKKVIVAAINELNGLLDDMQDSLAGKASLSNGKVPASQLPSYVDDVLEYEGVANFPEEGESAKIYIDSLTNKSYRWTGTTYREISSTIALGETSSTAFPGDRGKAVEQAVAALQAALSALQIVAGTGVDSVVLNTPTPSYEILDGNSAPSDWETDWTNYYEKVDDDYIALSGGSAPTYVKNTYYQLIDRTNTASGDYGAAFGSRNQASGKESFVSGGKSKATANDASAFGYRAEATGENSFVGGGYKAKATGAQAFATGKETVASGKNAFASGSSNTAAADYSKVSGRWSEVASGAECGSASGFGAKVTNTAEHAVGKYNDCDENNTDRLFSVGNGTGSSNRHNAFEVGGSIGNEYLKLGDILITADSIAYIHELTELKKLEFYGGEQTCTLVGIGSCDLKHIKIPSTDDQGRTVTRIASDIDWNNAEIIDCPDTLTNVAVGAFTNAPNLKAVRFFSTITFDSPSDITNVNPSMYFANKVFVRITSWNTNDDVSARAVSGYYNNIILVSTAEQLQSLGSMGSNSAAVLLKDIDTSTINWTGLGTESSPFLGSFDGNGHTVTVDRTIANPDGVGGLINYCRSIYSNNHDQVIRNVRVAGAINLTNTTSSKGYVGGMIGCVDAGTIAQGTIYIENCVSSVRINASNANTWYAISGFIGFVRHAAWLEGITIYMNSCLWDGVINAGPALEYSGGFVGYTGNGANGNRPLNLNISNSALTGTIMLNTGYTDDTGLLTGYLKGNGANSSTSYVHANFSNLVITGKFTSSVNLTKWCSLFQLSGTTEVNMSNFYYVSFSVPGKGTVPVYESSSGNSGTVTGEATVKTAEQMAALSASNFTDGDDWHFFNDGETAPIPATIYNMFWA